jgi:hypothetical protein
MENVQTKSGILVKKQTLFLTIGVMALLLSMVGITAYYMAGKAYERGFREGVVVNQKKDTQNPLAGYLYVSVMRGGQEKYIMHWEGPNAITDVGRNLSRHLLGDDTYVNNNATTHAFEWLNIGTGNGGGSSSTNLTTYFDGQQATFTVVQGVTGNFTMQYLWSAGSFSGETIQEAGMSDLDLFDSTATLFNYQDFTGITLQSTDSLNMTFEFSITSGS